MYPSLGLKVRGLVFQDRRAISVVRSYADDWTEKALQSFAREFDEWLVKDYATANRKVVLAAALSMEIGMGPHDLVTAQFSTAPGGNGPSTNGAAGNDE